MCMDHYQQSRTWTMVLENFNLFFIVIFTSEMLMKMFALRHHYFKDAWNLFDFVVVMMSLLSLFFSELIEKYFVSPTLLRVVSYNYELTYKFIWFHWNSLVLDNYDNFLDARKKGRAICTMNKIIILKDRHFY